MNGINVDGKPLSVSEYNSERKTPTFTCVFVKDLPATTTKEELAVTYLPFK